MDFPTTRKPGHLAQHPGHCPRCGLDITPGDRIILRGTAQAIHVGCASGGDE